MFDTPVELSAFEQFLKKNWPYSNEPSSMMQFCQWYYNVVDNLANVTDEDKENLRRNAIESWINLNIGM